MDPRIRRRRIEIRRREGRRRLLVLVGALAVAGLAAAAWGVSRSPLLDVDRIEVTGAVHSDADDIVRESGIRRGAALVDVDPEGAAAGARRVPWVQQATVRRDWGGTVSISVTERVPVAAARVADDVWGLVDADSRVLATVAEPPPGLVSVSGPTAVGPPGSRLGAGWEGVLAVAFTAPPTVLARVTAISETEGGAVELALREPGGTVRFGPPEQVEDKFAAIATVLSRVDTRDLEVLDVRIPRSPVLTRRDVASRVSTRTAG